MAGNKVMTLTETRLICRTFRLLLTSKALDKVENKEVSYKVVKN